MSQAVHWYISGSSLGLTSLYLLTTRQFQVHPYPMIAYSFLFLGIDYFYRPAFEFVLIPFNFIG